MTPNPPHVHPGLPVTVTPPELVIDDSFRELPKKDKTKTIEITERAYEVLLLMAEDADISEWIMNEWEGYCDANGEPDIEVG